MGDVRVVYRKYDGSLHWHLTMRYLGEDEHGVWTGLSAGGAMRKGDGPQVPLPHPHVGLFPRDAWWTAWFNGQPQRVDIYCDVTTVPVWTGREEVTMIDLDLDVARSRGWPHRVHLLDEDEFAEHRVRYGYPPEVVRQAENAAEWLSRQVRAKAEPFATVWHGWLAKVA